MITLLLVTFFLMLALGFPIGVAFGLSSVLGLLAARSIPLVVTIQRIFVSLDSFPLMAVPLYMLAGFLMGSGGISRRIISFSSSLVGHLTGGLAHVNILASMIFAGISGSAVADTAGIGNILIPNMIREKYSRPYSAAVTAISSTIGIVIPPSIPMVIIGAMLGISVGKLFLGGIIPGLLIGFALMLTAYIIARRDKVGRTQDHLDLRNVLRTGADALWSLLMPVVIVGGIVLGVFTPTEAGAVAVAYAFVVGVFIYRELDLEHILRCLRDTALATAKVFFIIAMAGLYTWLLTVNGFPALVGRFLLSITRSPVVMMGLIVLVMLLITTFMESIAALILLLPILYPVVVQVGIDPVYFGVMVVISIGIGLVTPPVGLCLYIAADIAEVRIAEGTRALMPFILTIVAILGILLLIPELILLIPQAALGAG
jgi:tripartite ATP-independent transporter DctM subunit